MRYCRNLAKAGLKLSQCMVATQESINSRFCSVVEINLSFFLRGGHLPRSGSTIVVTPKDHCWYKLIDINVVLLPLVTKATTSLSER